MTDCNPEHIGALVSRKTQASRGERLKAAGFTEEQVARISKTMKMPAKELQLPVMELSWHPKTVASSCVDANGFQ